MKSNQVLSEEVLKQAEVELTGGNYWIAYNTLPYQLEKGDVYFFPNREDAQDFAAENISDFDHYQVLKATSLEELLRQVPADHQLENKQNSQNENLPVMNEKNLQYLKENLKYLGFGDGLNADLEKNISQQFPEFALRMDKEINGQNMHANLYFRKGDASDIYFFNRWDGSLKTEDGKLEQSFFLNKGHGVTLKEGFNLLNSRAVNTDLVNKEGQKYNAWVQLDFSQRDTNGNYKLKQFHEHYGYDLAAVLNKLPIKELQDAAQKDRILMSLQKGNIQAVGFEKEGSITKMYIEANPQFKSLNVYDADMKRLGRDALEQFLPVKQSEPQKKESLEKKGESKKEVTYLGKSSLLKKVSENSLLPKKRIGNNHKKGLGLH